METETIIFIWLIMGLINLIILYIVQKKDPQSLYLGYGLTYEIGLLLIWFSFAFIIIPYFLIQYIRKLIIYKLNLFEKKLKEELNKRKKY